MCTPLIPELALNFITSARRDALNRAKTKGFAVDAMSYTNYRSSTIDPAMFAATLSAGKLSLTRNDRWLPPDVDNLVSLQPFAGSIDTCSILPVVFLTPGRISHKFKANMSKNMPSASSLNYEENCEIILNTHIYNDIKALYDLKIFMTSIIFN